MKKADTRVILSLLWVVIMINMVFNDIFTIIVMIVSKATPELPADVKMVMAVAAIITNIPIFMILLSRILKYKLNRILNIIAGVFTIVYVVGGGDPAPHYIIVASIECILAVIIIIMAWRWDNDTAEVK